MIRSKIGFTVGNLPAGASATLQFDVTINPTLTAGNNTLTNTATVTASNAAERQDSVSTDVSASPLLVINKTGPSSVAYPATRLTSAANGDTTLFVDSTVQLLLGQWVSIGDQMARITGMSDTTLDVDSPVTAAANTLVVRAVTYNLAYRNIGNADASGVMVTDTLPAAVSTPPTPGLGYFSSNPPAGSTPAPGDSGDVVWNLPVDLAAGASGSLQVTAFPSGPGSVQNSATIDSDQTDPANSSVSTVFGGLTVTKATTTPISNAGGTANYTITVSNSTGSDVAGVQVKDLLPTGFTYLDMTSSPAEPDGFEGGDEGRPYWTVDVLANNSAVITFQASSAGTVGAATYQNGVELPAADVGISPFDPLLTTAEDVTVLADDTGLVEGYVYRDENGNGLYNSGTDVPLANIAVTIIDSMGIAYVAYSDASGYFSRVVVAGSTLVDVDNGTLPAGLVLTTGTDGVDPSTLIVPNGGSNSRNTGYVPASGPVGSVNGNVWNDKDGNQAVDGDEPGMLGVLIILRDSDGNEVASAYTDVLGNYNFPGIPIGD